MFEEKDNTILARWLAGTLTQDELSEFEKTPEYKEYVQMIEGLNRFKKPSFDKEALRIKVKNKINPPKKGKVVNLRPMLYALSVAASVVLIIGFFFNEAKYETQSGEQLAITLPDGSKVQLNAQSKLTRARFFWTNNKKLNLQGEGFFKVQKGDGFTVKTPSGTITVLGTRFNIKTRKEVFELACYEGKVQFEANAIKEKEILIKGQSIKFVNDNMEKQTIEGDLPSWTAGRSSFNNVTLAEVIHELKIQYDITIDATTIDVSKRFSGGFTHNDLDIALKVVFTSMAIKYQLSNDRKTLKLSTP